MSKGPSVKASVILAYSGTCASGLYALKPSDSVKSLGVEDYIGAKIERVFDRGAKLCLLYVAFNAEPVSQMLASPGLPAALIADLVSGLGCPCRLDVRLTHLDGHLLRLSSFAQALQEKVNKVDKLAGSRVTAILEH